MVFEIPKEEAAKIPEWIETHECSARGMRLGAIGGGKTYIFTPTSIGVIITLECACGEQLDLSGDL